MYSKNVKNPELSMIIHGKKANYLFIKIYYHRIILVQWLTFCVMYYLLEYVKESDKQNTYKSYLRNLTKSI